MMNGLPEIYFIGTGSGSVSLKRNHSSFILKSNGYILLVDAGEGITRNLINAGVNLNSINSIIISHFHPDHINGISLLLNQMKMNKRLLPLTIYIHKNLVKQLINFIQISNIYLERLNFRCTIESYKFGMVSKLNNQLKFCSKLNSHLVRPEIALSKKLISSSFLFWIGKHTVFYSGDIGSPHDLYLFAKDKPDIFITESTHVSFEDIITVYNEIKPGKIILTHIPDDIEKSIKEKHGKLKKQIKDKIIIASDGMVFKELGDLLSI